MVFVFGRSTINSRAKNELYSTNQVTSALYCSSLMAVGTWPKHLWDQALRRLVLLLLPLLLLQAVGNENEDLDITAAEEHIAPECRKCSNCQEFDYGIHGTTMQQMCLEHSLACISDAEQRKRRRNPPALSYREEFAQSVRDRANERSQGWFGAPA